MNLSIQKEYQRSLQTGNSVIFLKLLMIPIVLFFRRDGNKSGG